MAVANVATRRDAAQAVSSSFSMCRRPGFNFEMETLRHMGKMLGVFALNVPILNSPYFDRSMIFCFDVFSLQLDQRQVFWL